MDGQAASAGPTGSTSADQKQQLDATGDGDGEASSVTLAPPWILSEVVTEKKSVFVARAATVSSVDQARSFVAYLLATDKKVAKATHNITAWRIRGNADAGGAQFKDCDDDGESAAGGRLLHLLELMGACNVVVVVSRWYGGVHLGPDRFRLINQCARDAISKGNLAATAQAESGDAVKKKGKK
jgi:putative IMPACT (imprinted ancient) family translation regulator